MLEVRFRCSNIPRSAQPCRPHALRYRSFNACSFRIGLLEFQRSLLHTPFLQCEILLLWSYRHRSSRCRRTMFPRYTLLAVAHCELHLDHGIRPFVNRRRPTRTCLSSWTCCRLRCPINPEIVCRKALAFPCLPTIIATSGSVQINGVLPLTFNHQLCVNESCINEMDGGQQIASLQCSMDHRGDGIVGGRG